MNKNNIKEFTLPNNEIIKVGPCREMDGLTAERFAEESSKLIIGIINGGTPTMFYKTPEFQKSVFDTSVCAMSGDKLIGAYSIRVKSPQDLKLPSFNSNTEKYAYMTGLFVDPSYRGCGIGNKVVESLDENIPIFVGTDKYIRFVETVTPNTAAAHLKEGYDIIPYPNQEDLQETIKAMQTIGRSEQQLLVTLVCMIKPGNENSYNITEHAKQYIHKNGVDIGASKYEEIVYISQQLRNEKKSNTPFEELCPNLIDRFEKHRSYFSIPHFENNNFHHYPELLQK